MNYMKRIKNIVRAVFNPFQEVRTLTKVMCIEFITPQVVWKDSKELGMARAKTPDGKSTYVVGRYRPAGNMLGNFEGNVFKR